MQAIGRERIIRLPEKYPFYVRRDRYQLVRDLDVHLQSGMGGELDCHCATYAAPPHPGMRRMYGLGVTEQGAIEDLLGKTVAIGDECKLARPD